MNISLVFLVGCVSLLFGGLFSICFDKMSGSESEQQEGPSTSGASYDADKLEAQLSGMNKTDLMKLFAKLLGGDEGSSSGTDGGNAAGDDTAGHATSSAAHSGSNMAGSDGSSLSVAPRLRLPLFSGSEPGKGEVRYEQWKYHVQSLIADPAFSDSVVMQAIRQSLRGQAADVMLFMGQTTPQAILVKLDSLFGVALEGHLLLKRFYWMELRDKESIVDWSCRLQRTLAEIADKEKLDAHASAQMLRSQFFSGLPNKSDIKVAIRHLFDRGEDFDTLFRAARKVETENAVKSAEHSHREAGKKPAVLVQQTDGIAEVLSEVRSMKDTLTGLSKRVGRLEKDGKQRRSRRRSEAPSDPTAECTRCFRTGHRTDECFARNDKDGRPLNGPAPASASGRM